MFSFSYDVLLIGLEKSAMRITELPLLKLNIEDARWQNRTITITRHRWDFLLQSSTHDSRIQHPSNAFHFLLLILIRPSVATFFPPNKCLYTTICLLGRNLGHAPYDESYVILGHLPTLRKLSLGSGWEKTRIFWWWWPVWSIFLGFNSSVI